MINIDEEKFRKSSSIIHENISLLFLHVAYRGFAVYFAVGL